jgi:hypothetical protein
MEIHQDLFNSTGLKGFNLDRALLGFDHRDDITAFYPIAWLDEPLNKCARFHIGTERRHPEFDHGIPS